MVPPRLAPSPSAPDRSRLHRLPPEEGVGVPSVRAPAPPAQPSGSLASDAAWARPTAVLRLAPRLGGGLGGGRRGPSDCPTPVGPATERWPASSPWSPRGIAPCAPRP